MSLTRPRHLPDADFFDRIGAAARARPVRILMSGCLAGRPVGVDGSTYGDHALMRRLQACARVEIASFCPEAHVLGVPRPWCDIADGDGFDVLDGRARVLSETGEDVTEAFREGAKAMAAFASEARCELAVLMDISAACGSQVIYRGARTAPAPQRQPAQGVAAAALIRVGLPVLSQRDFASLKALFEALQLDWTGPAEARDHHESDWYAEAFGS